MNFLRSILVTLVLLGPLFSLGQRYEEVPLNDQIEHPSPDLWILDYEIRDFLGKKLVLQGKDIAFYQNNQLVDIIEYDTLSLDQLGSGRVYLAFSSKKDIEFKLIQPIKIVANIIAPTSREYKPYLNYVSFYVSLTLIFLALIKWNQGKDLNEYLRIGKMFSPRNSDENILRNKLLTYPNFQYAIFFNLLVSGSIVCYENLGGSLQSTFGDLMFNWLKYFGLFGLFIIGKWLLVSVMSYIFNFGAFFQIHLINYLRISSVFAIIWAIVLLFFTWSSPGNFDPELFKIAVFSSAVVRMIILFLKLNNTEGYRGYHLFSYLCATEITPFFGVVFITSAIF